MELKVMTWNIKGGASLGWDREIKSEVADKIINTKSDLIVLTEFVIAKGIDYLFERLKTKGYIWFQTSQSAKNGLLIAVKENLLNKTELGEFKIPKYNQNRIFASIEGCNYLKVILTLKNMKNLCIFGVRMETGESNLQEQYNYERICFDKLISPEICNLNPEDYCIVCGDFNNAYCRGDLNKKFNRNDYKDLAQINFNLNFLKDTFENYGFLMADNKEGKGISKYKNYSEDHIFVKGFTVRNCYTDCAEKLSDHKILLADIRGK